MRYWLGDWGDYILAWLLIVMAASVVYLVATHLNDMAIPLLLIAAFFLPPTVAYFIIERKERQ